MLGEMLIAEGEGLRQVLLEVGRGVTTHVHGLGRGKLV